MSSKVREYLDKLTDSLNEQVWFQQIKSKWTELDNESQRYVKIGATALGTLLFVGILYSAVDSVRTMRKDLDGKIELLTLMQDANQELRQLNSVVPRSGSSGAPNWDQYFKGIASSAGFNSSNVKIKLNMGSKNGEFAKESPYTLTLNHINIKQAIRYGYHLENGRLPVRIKNMSLDTHEDFTGYVDAVYSVAAFTVLGGNEK